MEKLQAMEKIKENTTIIALVSHLPYCAIIFVLKRILTLKYAFVSVSMCYICYEQRTLMENSKHQTRIQKPNTVQYCFRRKQFNMNILY